MGIVRTIKCSNGATVRIHDDAYAGIPDDEILRRQQELLGCAKKIIMNAEMRRIREMQSAEEKQGVCGNNAELSEL